MISLELTRTSKHLNQMLASWNEGVRMPLAFSVGLNFLSLFVLTNTLALACVWATGSASGPVATTGRLVAWGQWVAGAFWGIQKRVGPHHRVRLGLAYWLAVAKFGLVVASLAYAVVMVTATIAVRSRKRTKTTVISSP